MENLELNKIRLETLGVLNEYLGAIIVDVKTVSDFFREDQIHEGLECMNDLTEGLQMIIEVINGVGDLFEKNFNEKDFLVFLQEMVGALENEDYTLLGDLLEYEIHPILIELKKNVETYI